MKSSVYLIALLFLALSLAACGGGTSEAADSQASNPTATVAATSGGDTAGLVARVNGEGITEADYRRALARSRQESTISDQKSLERLVLETLIEQTLIRQAAADLDIRIDEATLEAEFQENIELAGGEAQWAEWLENNLYTEAEFREALRNSLLTTRVRDRIVQNLEGDVPQVHARHILLHTEAEANAVLGRLNAGEDFETLAVNRSEAADAPMGGDLGWFTRQGLLEQTLADVAFDLEAGEIAGPVATRLGYHIIQKLESAERPVDPEARVNLAQIQFENWLQTLRERATIERFD